MKKGDFSWRGAVLIVSVFLGVIGFGLIYGILNLKLEPPAGSGMVPLSLPSAPTVEQYRSAAGEAMGPFVKLAFKAAEAGRIEPNEALLTAARAAESSMLNLRVPKEERDAHLEAVLLLEQWVRAMSGSETDARQVAAKTFRMIEKRPWLYR